MCRLICTIKSKKKMKKFILCTVLVFAVACFASCGNKTNKNAAANDSDSVVVDSTALDSLAADTLATDSVK